MEKVMAVGGPGVGGLKPPPWKEAVEPARLRHFTGSRAPCLFPLEFAAEATVLTAGSN